MGVSSFPCHQRGPILLSTQSPSAHLGLSCIVNLARPISWASQALLGLFYTARESCSFLPHRLAGLPKASGCGHLGLLLLTPKVPQPLWKVTPSLHC